MAEYDLIILEHFVVFLSNDNNKKKSSILHRIKPRHILYQTFVVNLSLIALITRHKFPILIARLAVFINVKQPHCHRAQG